MLTNKLIEELLFIRLCQILINEEYKAGKFKIPVHLALGHEAIAVAVSNTLEKQDKLLLTHRNMAYNLARTGGRVKSVLHEYYLADSGLAGGRLGSMNLINKENNIIYSSSILANNFSVSAGIAMAEKLRNTQGVTFVLSGDGAIEEGSFYESLMLMKSLGLAVVVIIENNEWSLGTHVSERRTPIDLKQLVASLGIDYCKLEGNNAASYLETLKNVRSEVLNTSEPVCVEVILKTLGDRRNPPSEDCPEGKYINYHAGPSPVVNINNDLHGALLRDNSDDPIYVLGKEVGMDRLSSMVVDLMQELKSELL